MFNVKKIVKKIILGYKADSESYIAFLKRRGAEIGENVRIFTPSKTHIDTQEPFMIHIGSNVVLTGPVTILTHDYSSCVCARAFPEKERAVSAMRPVQIMDNVFIGWGSTLLPGTTIGENSIIGAGAVVSGIIESNSGYVGNPARKLMSIEEFYDKRLKRQEDEAKLVYQSYVHRFGKAPQEKEFYGYESLWNKERYKNCIYTSFKEFCEQAMK